jgi:hypothetical protein
MTTRIDTLTLDDKRALQSRPSNAGIYDGDIEGALGPRSLDAYAAYWGQRNVEIGVPILVPAPETPWWRSGTQWALIATVLGSLAGALSGAPELIEPSLPPGVDSAHNVTLVITSATTLVTALVGLWRNTVRRNPIDQTLVLPGLRMGGHAK